MAGTDDRRLSYEELVAENERLRGRDADHVALVAKLEARIAELERRLGQNSGNSGLPSSRDTAGERQRQAEQRAQRNVEPRGPKRKRGKQRGAKGTGLAMSPAPDEIVDHRPDRCAGCGAGLGAAAAGGFRARQVIDVPEIRPTVTEHRAHSCVCSCGTTTTASFPVGVRAPVSYGPRVRATVVYLLARQHIPNRRVAETMADLFGVSISTGAIDSLYADAARRLRGFICALVAVLRSLPVLHADETTDRVGTTTVWLHVVSTGLYTLLHASTTRGSGAIDTAGVLPGYRGVIIHDRLALYWKLKRAKHGLCGAHLLRDLADVAVVWNQTDWATGLAALLVEINSACDDARQRGLKAVAPTLRRAFAARYDQLVAVGLAANPEPPHRKRDAIERRSHNLAVAFQTHRQSILRYMHDLDVAFTNNQAERDLRPTKLHRKISGCFRSQAGAERFAHVRSYLSTTRKNNITAIDALTDLFNDQPWMPPAPAT